MPIRFQPHPAAASGAGQPLAATLGDGKAPPTPRRRVRGGLRARWAYSWLLAMLLPTALMYTALAYPIEEHASDAASVHIYRAVVFSAARSDGWFYPRWVQPINGGLGGPLFSFYSPLVYFLADGLHAAGVPHPLAWRLIVALAFFAASTGAFALGLALFRRADVALAGAAVFTYAPYLLREHFERGSPEGLAIALSPWLLWALLRLTERPSAPRLALAAACWALMILAHNLAALLLLPVLGILLLYLMIRDGLRPALPALLALVSGVLLAGFYVFPFLAEVRYVHLGNASFVPFTQPAQNPLELTDLLAPLPVLDAGVGNNATGQPIGLPQALGLLAGLPLAALLWRRRRAAAVLVGGASVLGLGVLWLQTDQATWLWMELPKLSVIQFRWRLLSYVGLLAMVVLGTALLHGARRWRGAAAALLAISAVGSQLPSLYPTLYQQTNDFPVRPTVTDAQAWELEKALPGLTIFDELRPLWRTQSLEGEAARGVDRPITNLPDGARVDRDVRRTGAWTIRLNTPKRFDAAFRLLYFPGWAGYVDGKPVEMRPIEGSGYAELRVPAGRHTIELRYEGTPVQRASAVVSALTALGLTITAVVFRRLGRSKRAARAVYLRPRWPIAVALVMLVASKALWLDGGTTWLRWASTCHVPQGAAVQAQVRFGGGLQLCGYTLESREYRPGDDVRLTAYWQADAPAEKPANTFVHLLGTAVNPETGNPLWGQEDKEAPGGYSIVQWTPGKLYRDSYEFRIPPSTPPGEYQLEIGWWDPETGHRLPPRLARADDTLAVSELDAVLVPGIRVY